MKTNQLMINDRVPYLFSNKFDYAKIVGIRFITDIVGGEQTGVFTEVSYTIQNDNFTGGDFKWENFEKAGKKRIEQLRKVLLSEGISYLELSELEALKSYIDDGDVEMLEAAGVPE